jgi:dTDP-4-dehydrorhamnose 3,5-epimerase
MSSTTFDPLGIFGAYVIHRSVKQDDRGFLERVFDSSEVGSRLSGFSIAQVNRTVTARAGTVRGLHCQLPPAAETKLVTCLTGSVFDVIVDLRADSDTFGQWLGVMLDGMNPTSVLVPEGCAHGLQTLVPDVQMLYLHSTAFQRSCEAGLNPFDQALEIEWPVPVAEISERDRTESRALESFRSIRW